MLSLSFCLKSTHLLSVTYMLPRLSMEVLGSMGQWLPQWIDWLITQFFLILHGKHMEVRQGNSIT